jgi:single-stranded-DNA-specific exonuclease
LLEKFGGHAMAAGMTLRADRFDAFRDAFAREVASAAGDDVLSGDLYTDGPLEAGEFNAHTAIALRDGGPWGSGFAEPCFDGRFGVLDTRLVGGRHLKLRLRSPSGEEVAAIAFRYLDDPRAAAVRQGDALTLAYRAGLDEYGGTRRLQLVAEWLAPITDADRAP